MKKIHKDNIRIEVDVGLRGYCYQNDEEEIKDCEDAIQQIKRHVDNVLNCFVTYDSTEVCSFCGYDWDVDKKTGEPLCCDKAIEEWKAGK